MKVNRLVSIIMMLLDKNRINAQELAETFEVSQRTIYRDIDAINLAGIPVHAIPGVGGGFEIMQNYKVNQKVFSSMELSTILLALTNLPKMMQDGEVSNALVKIKSLVPSESEKEIELKSNQLSIDLSPWLGNQQVQRYLAIIQTALRENRLLSFDYADRYGQKTCRIVEPYQLVMKDNAWYWQGYCRTRGDYRLFKIIRVTNLQLLKESFVPREYQKPELDFSERLTSLQRTIKIRIHQSLVEQVLNFCVYENFTREDAEHYLVDFPFVENDFYYNMLFSFGTRCECLEPAHVRKEIKERIKQLTTLYAD